MTAPASAALRFIFGLLTGAALGFCYDFLRPLRKVCPHFSDFLFVLAAFYLWLFLSFRLCRADIRIPYLIAMGAGAALWEITLGRLFRPLFALFWGLLGKIWYFFLLPFKKTCKMTKKLFASSKKWVTIKWCNRKHQQERSGGKDHVKVRKIFQQISAGKAAQPEDHDHHADRCHCTYYGRTDRAAPF